MYTISKYDIFHIFGIINVYYYHIVYIIFTNISYLHIVYIIKTNNSSYLHIVYIKCVRFK